MTTATGTARPRRRASVVCALAIGALVTVAGVVWAVAAKASAEQSVLGSEHLVTLPVGVYTQYTQRGLVPDYSGLWVGVLLACVGVLLLAGGAILAFSKRRLR